MLNRGQGAKLMKVSISNIAWDVSSDDEVARLAQRHGLSAIDIAPGKYFSEPQLTTVAEIESVRKQWNDRGMAIVGMQSLLFGTTGLNMFGSRNARLNVLRHLTAVCRISSELGARWLVFSSPKNRDRTNIDDLTTERISVDFFHWEMLQKNTVCSFV